MTQQSQKNLTTTFHRQPGSLFGAAKTEHARAAAVLQESQGHEPRSDAVPQAVPVSPG